MLSFYLIWSTCYLILLWLLSRTWRLDDIKATSAKNDFKVSLLIPFRNEIGNLPSLVNEVQKLQPSIYEVILVDDHSEDESRKFLENAFQDLANITVLKSKGLGKKEAISLGVSIASGEIICCSDADCRFNENWIESITKPFQSESVQLVAGPVISSYSTSFFFSFQQIEWGSILLVTNYFFTKSNPLMCSAANMAYRKSAFEAVNGYQGNLDQPSGDDEFLLKKIAEKYPKGSCVYVIKPGALVYTESQKNWPALVQQRIRWASKWRAHQSVTHSFSAIFSFLVQLVWLASFLLLFQGATGMIVFWIVWILKILAEQNALAKPLKTYLIRQKLLNFICTSFLHPIFVLTVGFAALRGKFSWKGRGNGRSVILANKS
jgi:cellulose synthase/poly-beta-1,6-N-acetylglucosamine synthase-like glycosyltransferase